MNITVNGQAQTAIAGISVRALLREHGLEGKPCAVEVNREIVRSGEHDTKLLEDGDVVELVTLVGGG